MLVQIDRVCMMEARWPVKKCTYGGQESILATSEQYYLFLGTLYAFLHLASGESMLHII